jgi:iron complex outermembrane receptor protein
MMNRLQLLVLVTSLFSVSTVSTAWATPLATNIRSSASPEQPPATTVTDWLAQIEASLVQITDVRIDSAASGLSILLETTGGELTSPTTKVDGNALIVTVPNAVLALPNGGDFEEFTPAEGVALVSLTNRSGNQVQVVITGTDAPPVANVTATATGLALSVTPGVAQAGAADEAIQVVVEGQNEGYVPPPIVDVTRFNVPLQELPRSVQVVPQEVLQDQSATRIRDGLRNVSGVVQDGGFGGTRDQLNIRGFFSDIFRDGFRDPSAIFETSNIERLEVLKGPASILFGNIEPGGVINIVTEQPLAVPFYEAALEVGSFGYVRPTIDLSGPITGDGALRYRLNAAYEYSDGFRDFDQNLERFFIAPVLALDLGENTDLMLEFSYLNDERPFDRGLLARGRDVLDVPVRRFFGEPNDFGASEELSAGYRLNHQLSDDWEIRSRFRVTTRDTVDFRAEPLSLDEDTGILTRNFRSNDDLGEVYTLQNEVQGQFSTGSLNHRLVVGVDLSRQTDGGTQRRLPAGLTPSINVFDPVYNQIPRPDFEDLTVVVRNNFNRTDALGVYVQDLIEITDNFNLLLGGRLDFVEQESRDRRSSTTSGQDVSAFSPTIGLLYQPIEPLSIYANFARSFQPNSSTGADGSFLEPERGTQYEIGIRGELFEGNLTANLAAYTLTKTNLATTDPNNPDFSVPIAEQRSRGIELDIVGRILPGWNVIASYSHTDAEYTEEYFGLPPGSRVTNVPQNAASLWTTYQIQSGSLQGLGFGIGLFYVGERAGDFEDTFDLPSYLRTDAAIFYERNNWRFAINVQNLFDENYFIANNFGRVAIEPGAPLTVVGSLRVEF